MTNSFNSPKTLAITLPSWFYFASKIVDWAGKHKDEESADKYQETEGNKPRKLPTIKFKNILTTVKKIITGLVNKAKGNPKIAGAIIIVVLLICVAGVVSLKRNGTQTANNQTEIKEGPKFYLNKKFNVPIRNKDGETVGNDLIVNVTYLERTNGTYYQGKSLTAKTGKDFIIINMEIENSTNDRLTVKPVDFFRLIDTNGKSYAPDIQTDPVKVEPVSIKKTRTIYIVSKDQQSFKFLIGEIKGGNKETVDITI